MNCPSYASVFDTPYELVINAGYTGEKILSRWKTHNDAYCAMHENFTPEEQDELHVDIMKFGTYDF